MPALDGPSQVNMGGRLVQQIRKYKTVFQALVEVVTSGQMTPRGTAFDLGYDTGGVVVAIRLEGT